MKKHKFGVFISRFQPLHNGHIYTIEKMLNQCQLSVIVIGSSNKKNTERNPFDIDLRLQIVKDTLFKFFPLQKYKILPLPDWSSQNQFDKVDQWGKYLYYNIVSTIQSDCFTIYYNDNIDIINKWFNGRIKYRIVIQQIERINNISATKIREAILKDNDSYIMLNCPHYIYENKKKLKDILEKI